MIVGIDGWTPDDAGIFAEWGVTWTKLPVCNVDAGGHEGHMAEVGEAVGAGMTVIADLRPSDDWHQRIQKLMTTGGDEGDREVDALHADLREGVTATMEAVGDLVTCVEWWGEYDCPYVGGFWPNKRTAYPGSMAVVYDAAKAVAPDVQVWNGGYGVNFQPQFLDALMGGAPGSFDAANWHHYNISEYWPRDATGAFQFGTPLHKRVQFTAEKFRKMFETSRAKMAGVGCEQPFVSSEWGMPVVSDEVAEALGKVGLHSFVFQDGVYGLGDTEAAQFLDAWMEVFAEVGFEVLIYHRLHDSNAQGVDDDGTFWGNYCGLHYQDGSPKAACIEVLRRWIERGGA